MKEKYLVKYNADPSPLLLTDWTSDYLSGLEDGDDNEKEVHRIKMRAKAGLKDLVGGNEIVWERVRPGFRSDKVSFKIEKKKNKMPHQRNRSMKFMSDLIIFAPKPCKKATRRRSPLSA